MGAEVAQLHLARELLAQQHLGHLREQHLAAMRGREQLGGQVEGRPK
jgi:hypothetical protein